MEPKPASPLPSQGNQTANARRKYLHVLEGGTLKPHDLNRIVADMEAQDARVAALEAENARLQGDLLGARQAIAHWNSDRKRASGYTRAIQARVEAVVAARKPKELQ